MRGSWGWQVFKFLVIGIGGLAAALGCTSSKNDLYPETARVKIPWYTNAGYKLEIIELVSVTNMQRLQGWAAKFLLSPGTLNGKLSGIQPDIRTIRTGDGVYVPTDFLSSELLSMYAHFEKLQQLDVQLGVKDMIKEWPRSQTVAVRAFLDNADEWTKQDNALFSADLEAFLFVPYKRSELPLSVNAGVIGHEYFHALFHEIVFKPHGLFLSTNHDTASLKRAMGIVAANADTGADVYHKTLLRGINEGFADVWGWIYSGDADYVSRSNSDPQLQFRKLSLSPKILYTKEEVLSTEVYHIGTMYSHRVFHAVQTALKNKAFANEGVAKQALAKGILRMLQHLGKELSQRSAESFLEPSRPLDLLETEIPEMNFLAEGEP
jgi:hypothetical protein